MKPAEIKKYKVENMPSYKGTGDAVPNQFIITINTNKGTKRIFQSYDTVIAVKDEDGKITLDENNWDYSTTTARYRNKFLCENTAETCRKIKNGIYQLANLN
ncbi:MAG: hypothetical protein II453_18490 [Alphaproteobacteria bacterium]|nr:hypothetical protein [Alphaproteobacteria bacterium]